MSLLSFVFWLFAFVGGVVVSYLVPEETMSFGGKFVFMGAWGAVLGFVLYTVCKKRIENAAADFNENLLTLRSYNLDPITGLPKQETIAVEVPAKQAEPEKDQPEMQGRASLPPGAMPASEALKKPENRVVKSVYPLEEWKIFIKAVVRNRPFAEVLEDLNKLLPLLFPSASGVLYVYAGAQTDLHKVLSFGEHLISDDVIRPGECASFDTGEITITDYAVPSFGTGCTHLHHRPKGLSFCAPIEGFEEHFGIFTVQTDVLPDNESKTDWHFKVSMISSAIGLYIGNQNLNVRYNQHSIRDSLTGLYNRLYVQESLGRAVSSALRHKTPIGMIMLYPDAVDEIQNARGNHAVEQLLWELGQRLPGYIRSEDIPCRYEGNVLCVILPGADLKITRQRAEKIRHEISNLRIAYGDGILSTTLSMGVAVMPVHASDTESLIGTAYASMQYAMQLGANRVILADALMS